MLSRESGDDLSAPDPAVVMRSEERRALVLLGITAVLASILAAMYALIWSGTKLESFYFNFPCSAVPHLTVYDVPLLQALVSNWVFYGIFAFFYFSEDWFQPRSNILRSIRPMMFGNDRKPRTEDAIL